MKRFFIALLLLAACSDSVETRKQRLLIQGNEMVVKQDYEEAEKFFLGALKLDSGFADAWNNLGSLYFGRKEYTKAVEYYSRALDSKANYKNAYFNRANAYYELHEYYSALADVDRVAKGKDTVAVHFLRGLIHTRMNKYDDAIKDFDKALTLDSKNAEILVNLGTVLFYKKDYEKARTYLNKAIALNIKNPEPNAYNTLCLLEAAQGNYTEAMKWIDKALIIRGDDAYFVNNRGYLYLMRDDLEHALADINRSIGLDPYNGWAYRNKGIYLLKTGQVDEAIRLLTKAETVDKSIDKLHYYLGECYSKKNDKKLACAQYKMALDAGELMPGEYTAFCK